MQVAPVSFVLKVTVPPNLHGGGAVQVHGPQGGVFQVQVPQNLQPGDTFDVSCLNHSFAQPIMGQQRPYVQQNYRGRSPHYNHHIDNRCCYMFTMCISLICAVAAFIACLSVPFEDIIVEVKIRCSVLQKERLSLCMNEQDYYQKFGDPHWHNCEQATFTVQEGRLSWKSIGKNLIENMTSAPSDDDEGDRNHTEMRNDDAYREKKDWDEKRVKVDFPSVQISGNQEKGGFNDLLANDVFKEHNFMRQKKTIEKTMDSDHDIVLTSRKDHPRGLAILLTIVTVPMFAARVCSFCCRTRFEQYVKRPVHFAMFGTLHLALFAGYAAIMVIHNNLDVMRHGGSAVVERYPAALGCKGDIQVPLVVSYMLGVVENLIAGIILLSARGCCLYTGDLPVNGQFQQPVGTVLVNQPHIVTAQVVQPTGEYNIEKGAPNNGQTGSG